MSEHGQIAQWTDIGDLVNLSVLVRAQSM